MAFLENLGIPNKRILNFSLDEIDLGKIQRELKDLRRFLRKLKKEKSLEYYIASVLLFSILLDADKSDAGIKEGKEAIFKELTLSDNLVENYLKKRNFEEKDINTLRGKAFNEVISREIDIEQKIYSLTLPTGMGKTLISFAFALKLANKVKEKKGNSLKIIYSLPFLSIIEQNYSVLEKLLTENNLSLDTSLLLKHHHLTGFNFKYEENEFDYDSSRILIEGWNSKIIVTTFIQFFYSLIGFKNKMLRKFHKFTNSIVILDEIQSIPHKYWLVLKEILEKMTKKFNFYVILTTATQPMIFDKTVELVPNYRKYFKKLNRYNMHINTKEPLTPLMPKLTPIRVQY